MKNTSFHINFKAVADRRTHRKCYTEHRGTPNKNFVKQIWPLPEKRRAPSSPSRAKETLYARILLCHVQSYTDQHTFAA